MHGASAMGCFALAQQTATGTWNPPDIWNMPAAWAVRIVLPPTLDVLYAISEQMLALPAIILCLATIWNPPEDCELPYRSNRSATPSHARILLFAAASIAWLAICGAASAVLDWPAAALLLPNAVLAMMAYWWISGLRFWPVMFVCWTNALVCAFINYAALVVDTLVLTDDVTLDRLQWPGAATQWALAAVMVGALWVPMRRIMPAALSSRITKDRFWQLAWLFPCGITMLSMYMHPVDYRTILTNRVGNISLIMIGCLIAVFALIYTMIWLINVQATRLLDETERNRQLAVQTIQLQHLNDRIRVSRRERHDLRQHVQALRGLAQNGDIAQVRAYLDEWTHSMTLSQQPISYCDNAAANAVLVYYCDLARSSGARVDVRALLPRDTGIPDSDLCSLLGNLLENATDALKTEISRVSEPTTIPVPAAASPSASETGTARGNGDAEPYGGEYGGEADLADVPILRIRVRSTDRRPRTTFITVDNTYTGPMPRAHTHGFASSKHEGIGFGVESVRAIASRYHGTADFTADGMMFHASIMLAESGR